MADSLNGAALDAVTVSSTTPLAAQVSTVQSDMAQTFKVFDPATGQYVEKEIEGMTQPAEAVQQAAEAVQEKTAFLPDYAFANDEENAIGTTVSGIVGSVIVAGVAIGISAAAGFYRKKKAV